MKRLSHSICCFLLGAILYCDPTPARAMPNIPCKTFGGLQFWADDTIYSNWRIQQNVLTRHWRLLDPRNIRRAWGSRATCQAALDEQKRAGRIAPPKDKVAVLVHGVWGTRLAMSNIEKALQADGYETVNVAYPSYFGRLETHEKRLERMMAGLGEAREIDLVGYSMGGAVVRIYLAAHHDPRIQRAVLIATPNEGAGMADILSRLRILYLGWGAGTTELCTRDRGGIIEKYPAPWCECGVIAGGTGKARGINPLLKGDNDMTVEVEHTKVAGMRDFLLVHHLHGKIPEAPEVVAAVRNFLASGKFAAEGKEKNEMKNEEMRKIQNECKM